MRQYVRMYLPKYKKKEKKKTECYTVVLVRNFLSAWCKIQPNCCVMLQHPPEVEVLCICPEGSGLLVTVFGSVRYTLKVRKINYVLYSQVKTERMRQSDI